MLAMKKQEAPGALELVRAFVNTLDVEEGTELLADPAALGSWLRRHDLLPAEDVVGGSGLRRALAVREALRAVLVHNAGHGGDVARAGEVLDAAARRGRLRLGFLGGGEPRLVAEGRGVDRALALLLAEVDRAHAHGTWPRLKACPDERCHWAFYDHTKNRSGVWCQMGECGNRAKARAYRERRAHAS